MVAEISQPSVCNLYQLCLCAPTVCLRGDHMVPDLRSMFVRFTLWLLLPLVQKAPLGRRESNFLGAVGMLSRRHGPPISPLLIWDSNASPKTNSSGLMIRGESGTCAAACLQHTERENRIILPPQVAGCNFNESSDLSSDSWLPKHFKCLRAFIRYMRVNTHA